MEDNKMPLAPGSIELEIMKNNRRRAAGKFPELPEPPPPFKAITWGELKKMAEEAGALDSDLIEGGGNEWTGHFFIYRGDDFQEEEDKSDFDETANNPKIIVHIETFGYYH